MQKEIIIITGLPRSGTGIIAELFHKLGYYGGKLEGVDYHKHAPHFTNVIVTSLLSASYHMRTHIIEEKIKDIYKDHEFVFVHSPASYHYVTTLQKIFPDAKWIFVERAKKSIIDSCIKTSYMQRVNDIWYDNEISACKHAEQRINIKYYLQLESGLDAAKTQLNGILATIPIPTEVNIDLFLKNKIKWQ